MWLCKKRSYLIDSTYIAINEAENDGDEQTLKIQMYENQDI